MMNTYCTYKGRKIPFELGKTPVGMICKPRIVLNKGSKGWICFTTVGVERPGWFGDTPSLAYAHWLSVHNCWRNPDYPPTEVAEDILLIAA